MKKSNLYLRSTSQYIIGAVLSALTIGLVFVAKADGWFETTEQFASFALLLAAAQLIVQLMTFLHLSEEPRPRWKFHSFWFIFVMAVIIIIGSIWIMMNLDYNMGMSPEQMDAYMLEQNKKGF